ncbi:MAG TPA: hypothetical protein VJR29_14710 [bacterium]|nr:hypothetical protein [bacterium]
MDLLIDMFRRGNKADIMWFLGGAWLLLLFLGLVVAKVWKRIRRGKQVQP